MKRTLLALLLAFPLFAAAQSHGGHGGDGPKPLEPRSFFESIQGRYRIEQAGGVAPHGNDAVATVEIEGDQAVVTVPYCGVPGSCDPGYVFVPYSTSQVIERGADHEIYVRDGSVTYKYGLRVEGNRLRFTNFQYHVNETQVVQLEHVLLKLK